MRRAFLAATRDLALFVILIVIDVAHGVNLKVKVKCWAALFFLAKGMSFPATA